MFLLIEKLPGILHAQPKIRVKLPGLSQDQEDDEHRGYDAQASQAMRTFKADEQAPGSKEFVKAGEIGDEGLPCSRACRQTTEGRHEG